MPDATEMVSEPSAGNSSCARAWRQHIKERLERSPAQLELGTTLKPAAILLPIVEREEPSVLLTKRTEGMPTHAGQISFPGGRVHADDASLIDTALRELEEEIGISREFVEIAGFLQPYETVNSGFLILPVVGFIREDFVLKINPREVADVFEVPLAYLCDPQNRRRLSVERDGLRRETYAMPYNAHTIWGATAEMIVNLSARLCP
jgi:8-oxo-dGTP pyrophosphatase MutT (NUDIX family)